MRSTRGTRQRPGALLLGVIGGLTLVGCKAAGDAFEFLGSPFTAAGQQTQTTTPTTSGRTTGGATSGQQTGSVDPCSETQARKLVRIAMRNQSADYIHYFLLLVAFENGTQYPNGAVCPADRALYTAFGYTYVPAGSTQPFGNYCITGPALYYFHRAGQFRGTGGASGSSLASAIGPAQGASPTYDNAFTSAGLTAPVPEIILFHNPGSSAEGQALKVSQSLPSPCNSAATQFADPVCAQDAFYYVDETDRRAGSTARGVGSGRRVSSEIQGTGCDCRGISQGYQVLAASGQTATSAGCDEFFRGGRIDYVFVRNDTDPPYPQLLWRVTDSAGARAHDFDSRANLP
jgi:hypothetical protein